VLLPFAAQAEFPADTVFLIREADHTFTKEHAKAHEQFLKKEMDKSSAHEVASDRMEGVDENGMLLPGRAEIKGATWNTQESTCATTGSTFRVSSMQQTKKMKSCDASNVDAISKYLLDVVTTLHWAARHGADGFVWLAYNASHHWNEKRTKARGESPSAGAFFCAISSHAARFLIAEKVHEWPEMHTGTLYKKILEKYQDDRRMTGGYIQPAIGHYFEHVSSTWSLAATDGDVLPSHWDKHNICSGASGEGTVCGGRWICHYKRKGHPVRLNEEPFDAARYREPGFYFWRTQAPPNCPVPSLGLLPHHCGNKDPRLT